MGFGGSKIWEPESLVLFPHRPIFFFSHRVFWAVVRFNEARHGIRTEEELWHVTDISAKRSVEISPRYV